MSYKDAIAGFAQLHQAFKDNADRKLELVQQANRRRFIAEEAEKDREYKTSEREDTQEFTAKESTKARALGWAKFGEEKRVADRKRRGAEDIADLVGQSDIGKTDPGKAVQIGIESGNLPASAGVSTLDMDPNKVVGMLMKKAIANPKDAELMSSLNRNIELMDVANQAAAKSKEAETQRQIRIKQAGVKPVKYSADYSKLYSMITPILEEDFDYDVVGDRDTPLLKNIVDVDKMRKEGITGDVFGSSKEEKAFFSELTSTGMYNDKPLAYFIENTWGQKTSEMTDAFMRDNPKISFSDAKFAVENFMQTILFRGAGALMSAKSFDESGYPKDYEIKPFNFDMTPADYMDSVSPVSKTEPYRKFSESLKAANEKSEFYKDYDK